MNIPPDFWADSYLWRAVAVIVGTLTGAVIGIPLAGRWFPREREKPKRSDLKSSLLYGYSPMSKLTMTVAMLIGAFTVEFMRLVGGWLFR